MPANLLCTERVLRLADFTGVVDTSELQRIHPQLLGEFIHQAVHSERTLRMAGCAHRALIACIDSDVHLFRAEIRDVIDIGCLKPRAARDAAGSVTAHIVSDESSIACRTGAHVLRH